MGRLSQIGGEIQQSWKMVQSQWQAVTEVWKDSNCQRFGQDYLQVFEKSISPMINEFEKLDAIIQKAKQEVK